MNLGPSLGDSFERVLHSEPFEGYDPLGTPNWGGMGVVQRAWDRDNNQEVAIKVLHDRVSSDRFDREIRALKALDHPNIVQILDSGRVDFFYPYYIMAWHPGTSLKDFVREAMAGEGLDKFWLRRFFHKLAETLIYCHNKGVIHRDLKPDNILVDARGEPILIDFGLVKASEDSEEEWAVDQPTLTKSGEILGTPAYMAPEQLDSSGLWGSVSEASDVWSFGATLYFALTGCSPFQTESIAELYYRALNTEPTPVAELNPDAAPLLIQVVQSTLRREQESRAPLIDIAQQLDLKNQKEPARIYLPALALFLLGFVLTSASMWFFLRQPKGEELAIESVMALPKLTNAPSIKIAGKLSQGHGSVIVKGEEVQADESGAFETMVTLQEGPNRIWFSLPGNNDLEAFKAQELICDRSPPELVMLMPQGEGGIYLCEEDYVIKGQLIDKHPHSVSLSKKSLDISLVGEFSFPLPKVCEVQNLTLLGRDQAGNIVELCIQVQEGSHYEKHRAEARKKARLLKEKKRERERRLSVKTPNLDEYPFVSDFAESIAAQREKFLKQFPEPHDQSLLRPLLDIDEWMKIPRERQEATLSWIGKRLGDDFEFVGSRRYQCGETRCFIGRFRHKATGLTLHLIPGGSQVKRWFLTANRSFNLQVLSLLASKGLSKSLLRYTLMTNSPGDKFREKLIEVADLKNKIKDFDQLMEEYRRNPWGRRRGFGAKPDVFDAITDFFFKDPQQLQWLQAFLKRLHKSVLSRESSFFSGEYIPPSCSDKRK